MVDRHLSVMDDQRSLASQRMHRDLHTSMQAQHHVQSPLLLDVVGQRAAILELLAVLKQ